MINDIDVLLISVAAAVTLFLGLMATPIASRLGILDHPDNFGGRRRHGKVTPQTGGIMIMVPLLLLFLYWFIDGGGRHLAGLGFAAGAFFVIGLLDDRRHIMPSTRLLWAIIAAYLAPYALYTFLLYDLQFSIPGWNVEINRSALPITILCVIGLANAVNMADGKNGLVIGMCLIWTALLFAYGTPDMYPVYAVLGVTLIITFIFNVRGHVFLGDSGSLGLGALFGYLAIHTYNTALPKPSADLMALWFLVPILDLIRLFILRLRQGRSPFSGDREHLHHLIYSRLPGIAGLILYLALIATPNLLAYLVPEFTPAIVIGTVVVFAVVVVAFYPRIRHEDAHS